VDFWPHDVLTVGLLATVAVERAIVASILAATPLQGIPSAGSWAKADYPVRTPREPATTA
jgi:hypothetical protein